MDDRLVARMTTGEILPTQDPNLHIERWGDFYILIHRRTGERTYYSNPTDILRLSSTRTFSKASQ